jgi:hypothetical protein
VDSGVVVWKVVVIAELELDPVIGLALAERIECIRCLDEKTECRAG